MRRIQASLFAMVTCATPATADVDCTVVERLARIHGVISNLRSNPTGPYAANNLAVLHHHLGTIDARDVQRALKDNTNQSHTDDLQRFAELAMSAGQRIATTSLDTFTKSLRIPEWDMTMDAAQAALQSMPCGVTNAQSPGDAIGRELQSHRPESSAFDQPSVPTEKVKETVYGFLFLLVVALLIGRPITRLVNTRLRMRRRRSKRFPTQIDTNLAVAGEVFEANVVDLSCEGAKVRYWHDQEITSSEIATIELRGETYEGIRAWSNPLFFGLRFTHPLPIDLVRELSDETGVDGLGRPKNDTKKAATA